MNGILSETFILDTIYSHGEEEERLISVYDNVQQNEHFWFKSKLTADFFFFFFLEGEYSGATSLHLIIEVKMQ